MKINYFFIIVIAILIGTASSIIYSFKLTKQIATQKEYYEQRLIYQQDSISTAIIRYRHPDLVGIVTETPSVFSAKITFYDMSYWNKDYAIKLFTITVDAPEANFSYYVGQKVYITK